MQYAKIIAVFVLGFLVATLFLDQEEEESTTNRSNAPSPLAQQPSPYVEQTPRRAEPSWGYAAPRAPDPSTPSFGYYGPEPAPRPQWSFREQASQPRPYDRGGYRFRPTEEPASRERVARQGSPSYAPPYARTEPYTARERTPSPMSPYQGAQSGTDWNRWQEQRNAWTAQPGPDPDTGWYPDQQRWDLEPQSRQPGAADPYAAEAPFFPLTQPHLTSF